MKQSKSPESIKVRRINFGHQNQSEKYWAKNNPFITHFLNSLHSVFPDGEKLFIRSVKYFQNEITDKNLKERVKRFIGQEMQHATQHQHYWKTLDKWGLQGTEFTDWYAKDAYDRNEGLLLGTGAMFFGKRFADKMSLSVTSALEHYTAILAEVAFENSDQFFDRVDEDMTRLLQWHAAEEIEHKSVAFDVMQNVAGVSYIERVIGFAIATFFLNYYIALGMIWYVTHDKEIQLKDVPGYLAEWLPELGTMFFGVARKAADYLVPGFHPEDSDNDQLAEEFFRSYHRYLDARAV